MEDLRKKLVLLIVVIVFFAGMGHVWAKTWQVTNTSQNLQDIIDLACDGDTIQVCNGIHRPRWNQICWDDEAQIWPTVAYNEDDNEYAILWKDNRNGTYEIWGRIVSSDGVRVGNDVLIVTGTTHHESEPSVTYGDGGYYMVYAESGTNGQILHGVFLGDDLSPGPKVILTETAPHPRDKKVVYNSTNNEFMVVWLDKTDDWWRRVRGTHVDSGGNMDDPVVIREEAWVNAEVAWNSDANQYLVTWSSWQGAENKEDVLAQRLDADLSPLGAVIGIWEGAGSQYIPKVVFNESAQKYLVTFTHDDGSGVTWDALNGQFVLPNGNKEGEFFIILDETNAITNPTLAYRPDSGDFIAVWEDHRLPEDVVRIYGQIIDASGGLGKNAYVSEKSNAQSNPAVASGAGGGAPFSSLEEGRFRSLEEGQDFLVVWHNIGDIFGTLKAQRYETTCGNCNPAENPFVLDTPVAIEVGFHIKNKELHLKGESKTGTILNTGANYGVLFEDAGDSIVADLTVTGGIRNKSPFTTDAAIIARGKTYLEVDNVYICCNEDIIGEGSPYWDVGIVGIAGREGSRLFVHHCIIEHNSWDGIALYQSGGEAKPVVACICDNYIRYGPKSPDDKGRARRGVGIGVTWDASATILRNWVYRYQKGIGGFGTSVVTVKNNAIFTFEPKKYYWGLGCDQECSMIAANNVISNAKFGVLYPTETGSLELQNNIIFDNEIGIIHYGVLPKYEYNDFWQNEHDLCGDEYPNCLDYVPGNGNISQDPLFIPNNIEGFGFEYTCQSPCIDSGNPSWNYYDLDLTRNNMGLYGGPYAAEMLPECNGPVPTRTKNDIDAR